MLLADEKRLALLAVCVRSGVVLLTTALDIALPDYDTSKFITPEISKYLKLTKVSCLSAWPCGVGMRDMAARGMCDPLHSSRTAGQLPRTPSAPLQGWLVWDSVFFADIAARGYAFEQYYAFFPLLPGLVSLVAPTRLFAVVALAINAAASVLATVLLYILGKRLTGDRELAALACLFFILNPATIFHAAPYSEAGFTAATLAALYWLYCRGRLAPAVAAVAVSCGLRSNGVINAGYLGHYCCRRAVAVWPSSKARALGHVLLGLMTAVVAVLPTAAFQHAAYSTFCLRNTSTSTSTSPPTGDMDRMRQLHREWTIDNRWPRPWCSAQVPYVYGFVQSEYWNVGFLRYWTWQQLPNFLLAAPVVLLSVSGLAVYCTANCRHVMLRLGLTPLEPAEPPPRGAHPGYDDDDGDDGDDGEAAAAAEEEDDISDGKGGDEEVGVDGAAAACGPLSAAGFEPQKGKAAEAEPGGQPRFQAPGPDSSTGLRQRRRQRQEDSAGCSQDDAAADDGAAVSSALDDGPRTHGSHDWSPAAVRAEGPLVASLLAAPSGLGRREGVGGGSRNPVAVPGDNNDVSGRDGNRKGGREKAFGVGSNSSSSSNSRGGDGGGDGDGDGGGGYLDPELAVFMYPWAFSLAVALVTMHIQVATRFLLSACPPLYWYMAHVWLGRQGAHGGPGATRSARFRHGCIHRHRHRHLRDGHAAMNGHGYRSPSQADCSGGGGNEEAWQGVQSHRNKCKGEGGGRDVAGQQGSGWCAIALWRWCLTYMVVGCVLFINFYPWT